MFGPGLLATLGEYIRSSIYKAVNKIYLPGEQHRKQRKMLNPVFSIAHLRGMSELWSFFWSPRTERAIVPTFYRVSYKVPLLLNCQIAANHSLTSFETPSLERWIMVHRRLMIIVLAWICSQYF